MITVNGNVFELFYISPVTKCTHGRIAVFEREIMVYQKRYSKCLVILQRQEIKYWNFLRVYVLKNNHTIRWLLLAYVKFVYYIKVRPQERQTGKHAIFYIKNLYKNSWDLKNVYQNMSTRSKVIEWIYINK